MGIDNIPISAKLDSINISVNGTLDDPIIESYIDISNLNYENQSIGNFYANINYISDNIIGEADIRTNGKKLFQLNIKNIPIYLGFDTTKKIINEKQPVNASIIFNELQAKFFSPFIPSISDINGRIKGNIDVGGYLPEKITYTGKLNLDNLLFRVEPINMRYIAFGNIDINTDEITFNNLKIKNSYEDLRNGEITLNGKVDFQNFNIKNIDITGTTRSFQILSEHTQRAMP
jgi:hypothetical protein